MPIAYDSLDKHLPLSYMSALLFLQVYDLDQSKYLSKGLDFRHTDNLNFFVNCLPKLGLSKVQWNCYYIYIYIVYASYKEHYSGTSILWTPLGTNVTVLIVEVSLIQG